MVLAGIYPVDTEDYEELRKSMEKLQLNDASLTFEPESSVALGFILGVAIPWDVTYGNYSRKVGKRFNMTVITTVPNVSYKAYTTLD